MEALLLGIDNSLIPVEISCNEIHKYWLQSIFYNQHTTCPHLKGIQDLTCACTCEITRQCITSIGVSQ